MIVQWQQKAPEFDLVVVNLASHRSQCSVSLTAAEVAKRNWLLRDVIGFEEYKRNGGELQNSGLYLDLPAFGAQVFHFKPTS